MRIGLSLDNEVWIEVTEGAEGVLSVTTAHSTKKCVRTSKLTFDSMVTAHISMDTLKAALIEVLRYGNSD